MAPGDRQLESQIVSLQTRLRSPQAPPVSSGRPGAPAAAVSELTAPFPRPAAPAPPGAEDVRAGRSRPPSASTSRGDRGPRPHDAAPASAAPDRGPAGARFGVRPAAPPPVEPRRARAIRLRRSRPPASRTLREPAPDVGGALLRVGCRPDAPDRARRPGLAWRTRPRRPRCRRGRSPPKRRCSRRRPRRSLWTVARAVPPPAQRARRRARREAGPRPSRPRRSRSCTSGRGSWTGRWRSTGRCSTKSPGTSGPAPGWPSSRARPPRADARAARRAALERTIAGLEALLVVLQRR